MPGATSRQIHNASAKSAWVRSARVQLRQAIKDGAVDPYSLLRGNQAAWEPVIDSWRLDRLLRNLLPGVGEQTADALLAELRVPGQMTLAGLTYERRAELASLVRDALEGVQPGGVE